MLGVAGASSSDEHAASVPLAAAMVKNAEERRKWRRFIRWLPFVIGNGTATIKSEFDVQVNTGEMHRK
ncbi:hypothetical protein BGC_62550 [Burkholderia sp. 3C]